MAVWGSRHIDKRSGIGNEMMIIMLVMMVMEIMMMMVMVMMVVIGVFTHSDVVGADESK